MAQWLAFWTVLLFFISAHGICYRKVNIRWREDGRCGVGFPLATGRLSECDPKSDRPCCSDFGFCGNSALHCRCPTCKDYRRKAGDVCEIFCNGEKGVLEADNLRRVLFTKKECYIDLQRQSTKYCGVMIKVDSLNFGTRESDGSCENAWISMPSCLPEPETRMCGKIDTQSYQYLFQRGSRAVRFRINSRLHKHDNFKIRYELLTTCPGPYQSQSPPISLIPGTNNISCYTRITDLKGTINTPYYPSQYPNNLDCIYEFVRVRSDICGVEVSTGNFHLEEPIWTPFGGACKDFLHVPSCSFMCGKVQSKWFVQYQPGATSLLFHLHTDQTTNSTLQSGFVLKFQQLTYCKHL